MQRISTDICIIGAGSGGLSVAAGAAQMGARVVLIEGAAMGGDCLNYGCVPSKALLAAGRAAQVIRMGAPGVQGAAPQIDFAAVKAQVAVVIAQIAPLDSQERFEGFGVQVIRAYARFTSPREVEAGGKVIRARRFVIATGSHPTIPQLPGLEAIPYLTNETIFAQTERPDHLLILGGGPIAIEMAQAHRRLGCAVTVIARSRVLSRADPEAVAVVLTTLRAEGVEVLEGRDIARLLPTPQGLEAVLNDGTTLTGSHLLIATGRTPAIAKLNLPAAGVAYSDKGVTVGANLRSSNRRIYAVGDVAGGLQFTHVAGAHAGVVIKQMLFCLPAKQASVVPMVTYTDPELAQIGLTEAEARAKYPGVQVIRQEFSHNDRAVTDGKTAGFLKLMLLKDRPVGVTLVGAGAGELIGLWALAMTSGLKVGALAGMIAPYPTRGEISKRAAGAYFSPKLFDNMVVKRVVRLVQRLLP
ncbi:NAD(P)/FAD-dependent oxidoreductase [Cypionkella sp.]|uniref:dihydrolipoyl dehydrogenase family protein n=1 Tax=Cypionkella sp. TaxID=2811411 RepID=UPI00271C67B5|nr:FAD-dependent oxidoreductase [Cypionkella sp.]MDO8986526.1 FAD-dependent oxidoreductase [Cypionkella sp.]MDP1576712.1 FAD-dependent oxidoreductase [Cypionkella sp.]MDP2051912.1 FAD-dependent oxidoreductase [Cypionkella sp.]